MLVFSRKRDEQLVIVPPGKGEFATIAVIELRGDKARLGVVAPSSWNISRKEIFDRIRKENQSQIQKCEGKLIEQSGEMFELMHQHPFLIDYFPFRAIDYVTVQVANVLELLSHCLKEGTKHHAEFLRIHSVARTPVCEVRTDGNDLQGALHLCPGKIYHTVLRCLEDVERLMVYEYTIAEKTGETQT